MVNGRSGAPGENAMPIVVMDLRDAGANATIPHLKEEMAECVRAQRPSPVLALDSVPQVGANNSQLLL